MKSIRLSLVVYFLALIAAALGGVSALAYQATSTTFKEKEASTVDLIRTQFKAESQEIRAALDRRIVHQAQLLARKAQRLPIAKELYVLTGTVGAVTAPAGIPIAPLSVSHIYSPIGPAGAPLANLMAIRYSAMRQRHDIQIPAAVVDFYMSMDDERPLEVFQTYRRSGFPAQRSPSLKDQWLTLSDEFRERAEDLEEEYDDIDLDGHNLRRVTLKTSVSAPFLFGPYRSPFGFSPKSRVPAPNKGPSNGKGQALGFQETLFIQYAADSSHVEDHIALLESKRDERLARVHQEMQASLAGMRRRLFWIASITFLAVVAGGLFLVRLGLAPLARLSDAVSKVSEKNFQLQVDTEKLPKELQPIAERLRQSLQQLRKAFDYEKQAAADISHELRTPLAALLTTLDVALRKSRSPEEYREILAECRLSGQHMSHLVERLMALARLDAGVDRPSLEPVDVAELAQQCADMVRPLAEEQGLELHTRLDESIVTVTDARKVRDIVVNLLHNAIAYNKPHGSIELEASRENSHVLLAVRDTGIGIAPEAQAHLFERFFRADPSRHADTPHCGLGLAIVKSYVDLLDGTIRVTSNPEGTTFEIRLPMRNVEPSPDHETMMQTVAD